ncbi:hypothetical protein Glove_146g38 [Diversispora epigaea]|uniref:Exportin-1/Importin-beta-like domain-containing protein n=1 Tax=Diversispora epigaea TaxID=1348612 RepID=A0A397J3G2_9GLOM|nr:hypothetical protein Glove_146g38 [Diversispora epigaea]
MPLQFWYVLQESLFDPGVIPVNGENISGSKMVSLEEAQKIREASIIVFQRLLEVVRTKVQYPPDDEWAEWAKDVKDRFRVYRRDVGDTVLYAYYVLRNQMFAYLVELAIMQLSMPGRDSSQWQDLESTLFCLKSISEAVDHKENRYLPRLFGSEVYGMLPVQGSSRLRNTALSLIGSYAEWLKRHPEYIFSALNYLVSGLSDPETSSVSALSFKEVCDTCRESLVNEIDSLINMYMVVGPHIQTREKQRVIESIADVIQALPPEKKMEPLLIIANSFIGNLREAIIHGKQNPSPYREAIIIHLEYLTCCGRGIQPPDDEVIIIDDDDVISKEHILSSSPSPSNLSNALTEITGNVAEIWCQDNEVMECLCKFLNTGIRVTENLLSIPFEVIISLVQISYLRNPFSCWLDTAAQVVTVFGPNSRHGPALRNMLAEITTITIQQYVRNQADMENNPDLVNSYFAILTKFIQKCPLLLYNLPPELFNNIMKFSVVGLSVQERLALKSAITFMGEFVGQHYEDEQLSKGIENIMMTYGMEIMRELISGIGGKLPRSFVVSLSHVLHKITSRYVEASKEWLSILLNQENFPSHHADLATKQHFAKSILGTRSIQKYKEIVTNFSIKCRALGDTAYGYA